MRNEANGGFTLMELVVVVAILSIIATLAVPRMARLGRSTRVVACTRDLQTLGEAFTDPTTGYLADFRGIPGFSTGNLRLANILIATNLYGTIRDTSNHWHGVRIDLTHVAGCAAPEAFTRWDAERERGWRGPYVRVGTGTFPARKHRRFADDATAEERGFYPVVTGLNLPDDILRGWMDCSAYGFPGEPGVEDPWGNPYVLQIPPAQAFRTPETVSDEERFAYARIVSAGPNGRLETPCYGANATNAWGTSWDEPRRRRARQAGRYGADCAARGDDLVRFLWRNDTDEGVDR